MLFHTIEFGIFFALLYPLYLLSSHKIQNRLLLVGSYVFYSMWDWRFTSLIILSTVTDFICARGIDGNTKKKTRIGWLSASLAVNLGLLGTFKYFDFFAHEFKDIMGAFGIHTSPYFLDVVLPVGISFYTFQTLSYTIDVYRGKVKPTDNIFDFALFVAFFPQLIAGPIERATNLLPQIVNPRTLNWKKVQAGAFLFFWGYFIKVIVADNMARIVDPVYDLPGPYDGATVILAVYAFSFQILCDFAGYSWMAIGLGKLMGIELMENFRRPYFAENIQDFWRRWHISLSTWFRDYLYIPLGGSKKGLRRTLFNAAITFLLVGLWHGAGWNFIVWGAYHASMLGLYLMFQAHWDRMNKLVKILLTYHIVCGGWLIFRAASLTQAVDMFAAIAVNTEVASFVASSALLVQIVGFSMVVISVHAVKEYRNNSLAILDWPVWLQYTFYMFLLAMIVTYADFANRPFIYFQF